MIFALHRAVIRKDSCSFFLTAYVMRFGKGFDKSNLRNMRRFYNIFPIRDALRPEFK